MEYKTFAQIKTKIDRELDLETEDFIQEDELKEYVNDAIEVAQAEIHKLGIEDEYFLTKSTIDLVDDQSDYDLPTNIYSNKIKFIEYSNGTLKYPVRRLRMKDKFDYVEWANQNNSTGDYRYLIRNDSAAGKPVIELVPKANETTSDAIKIWYYRNANKWTDDDTEYCDLPEIALQYVYAYVRYRCMDKEGHPNQMEAKDLAEKSRILMINTLTNMVPDEDSEIIPDLSFYDEFS
jgi:hypothetical protein